ncbi:MarR family winged helix-turn-helix transcriptional regulator [Neptuniibacter sp. 2_MG-2023]|uniref:MarR family winged helix-turn-helix transcriptional regulator n=1 Tax=Neptuniibacter sp. 2_MG-2023 TaxID=3062671 RepID=UPI0026E42455|nr:MarR family transcriptional regulator [Neptuniibacter sp. 2_MG-2023]MDO6513608.1 MarR family transcriptional regulator [Neptuniibacter sp. 2_MG-2023]
MSNQKSLENLFRLVHGLKRQMYKKTEQLSLDITPMHIRVLKIVDRKKPCTAVDIVDILGRDKGQVTRLINTLIDKGLIEREPNPNDKRSHYLSITNAGIAVVEEVMKIDADTVNKMTKNLKREELAEFERISELMANNLYEENN